MYTTPASTPDNINASDHLASARRFRSIVLNESLADRAPVRSPLGLSAPGGRGASMGDISSEGKFLGVSGLSVEVGFGDGGGGGGGVVICRIGSA
jgi:hypothetical protein